MWYRKEKIWSGEKVGLYLGYDLWGWALPLMIDKDYGLLTIQLLCFRLQIGVK